MLKDFWPWLLLAGAAILAALGALRKAEKVGGMAERLIHQKVVQDARERWDEIDSGRPDFDAAVERLYQRSGGTGLPPSG